MASVLPHRIAEKIHVSPCGCYEWTGAIQSNGYGRCWDGEKVTYAHRVVYSILVGEIEKGLDLDHLCRNRKCVNPDHLEPVTRSENLRRGETGTNLNLKSKAMTKCKMGHEFTEENTRIYRGKRCCRACARQNYHRKKK